MAVIFGIDWFLLLTPDVMHDAFVPDFLHLMLGDLPAARRKVEILLFTARCYEVGCDKSKARHLVGANVLRTSLQQHVVHST